MDLNLVVVYALSFFHSPCWRESELTSLSILFTTKHLTAADTKGSKLTSPTTTGNEIKDYAAPKQIHWHPAAADQMCTCWRSAIGRVQDAVADDRRPDD